MRRIEQPQYRAASSQLNLIFVEQICAAGYPPAVDERAVEALQINNCGLIVHATYFGMPSRNDRRGGIDDDVSFRIASEANHLFVHFKTARGSGLRVD